MLFSEPIYFERPRLCVNNPGFGVVNVGRSLNHDYRGIWDTILVEFRLWLQKNLMSHCCICRDDFNPVLWHDCQEFFLWMHRVDFPLQIHEFEIREALVVSASFNV